MNNLWDLAIIGTGPAGLSAAIYAQRYGLRTIVFGDTPGGRLSIIEKIENYPGFPEGTTGPSLGLSMFSQAQKQGAHFTMTMVVALTRKGEHFYIRDSLDNTFYSKTAILACGLVPSFKGVPLTNKKGIYLCATCDGPMFRGKDASLAVIGGGNTAGAQVLQLANVASQVHLLYRGAQLKMERATLNKITKMTKVKIWTNVDIKEFLGDDSITGIKFIINGEKEEQIEVSGVFLAVGWETRLSFIELDLHKSPDGYILTDNSLMTNVPGLFAAGDVRDTDLRQVISACADGARAAKSALEYISNFF